MKRYLLILTMLLGAFCSQGQNQNDMTALLQKCIDLPELQSYYPLDANGKPDEVYINFWAPTIFSTDLVVTSHGEKLKFLPMSQASPSFQNALFMFKNCHHGQNYEINQIKVPKAIRITALTPPLLSCRSSSSSYICNFSLICLVA